VRYINKELEKIHYVPEKKATSHLVKILSLQGLSIPFHSKISARYHYGEEAQDPEAIAKNNLIFLSGEALPQFWLNPYYRDN
jgi:hypothetical protein